MPQTAAEILGFFLTYFPEALALYTICCAASAKRLRPRDYLVFTLLEYGSELPYLLFYSGSYSGLGFLFTFWIVLVQGFFVFRKPGRPLWRTCAANMVAQCGYVVLTAVSGMLIFGPERANAIAVSRGPDGLLQSALDLGSAVVFFLLLGGARRLLPRVKQWGTELVYALRAVLLLAASAGAVVVLLEQLAGRQTADRLDDMNLLLAVIGMMAFVCLSYLVQDMAFLRMRRSSDTLARQKEITDALIADTRFFRHNVLNMIYGFDGALLTGTAKERVRYHAQLAQACTRINNENVLGFLHLDDLRLEKHLMKWRERADAVSVPFYLTVEPFPRLNSKRTEQLLALLDAFLAPALAERERTADARVSVALAPCGAGVKVSVLRTLPPQGDEVAECDLRMCDACILRERRGRLMCLTAVVA